MTKQINPGTARTTPSAVQSVQTTIEEGRWMFLLEATDATGLSEKTLRRYIKKKQVKWRRLGKQTNSPLQVWVTPEILKVAEEDEQIDGIADFIESESEEIGEPEQDFSPEPDTASNTQANPTPTIEQIGFELDRVLKTITQQFAEKLDQQKDVIYSLRTELHEKDIQLRLLPDLQKQLEDKEKASEFETRALEKQVEELKAENERLHQEAELAKAKPEIKKVWWQSWFANPTEK